MGNLVFQATLGGQVNLVGPNTASTFNLNVPAVAGTLVTTGDTGTVTNTMLASSAYTAPGTIGSGTPNTGAFTTLSATGNVTFSGAGAKIAGDFSNSTLTNRAAFQTTTSNGSTGIYALPNGTSTAASWQATNAADPTNASKILIATNGSTDVQLVSGINGTGTYLPLTFYTNGAEKMRLDTAGNLGLGVTPSAWNSSSRAIQFGSYGCLESFTGGEVNLLNNLYRNSGGSDVYIANGYGTVFNTLNGAFRWYTSGSSGTAGATASLTQAMTLDASGNLGIGATSLGGVGVSMSGIQYPGVIYQNNNAAGSGFGFTTFQRSSVTVGSISQNGTTGVLYNLTSDYRLKNDQQPLTGAKEFVMALQPKKWQWWDGSGEGVGFIAHEFMEVAKYSGHGEKDAVDADGNPVYQTIQPSSSEVMANLVALIQEQQAIITQLQADVAALKAPK
jgi:hypothetical protein